MPKISYNDAIKFKPWKMELLNHATKIIDEYRGQGFDLTLRQVYYQFVARDLFPPRWADPATGSTNNQKSYDKLGALLSDARMAGLLDWNSLVDRTREKGGNSHWDSPASIIEIVADSYQIDKWAGQKYRPEIWVEKDALEGVVARIARELDVQYFSCRGYTSLTSIWENAQHLKGVSSQQGQIPVVLHLGDHDPSGIDMSRDIEDRVRLFMGNRGDRLVFKRLALNMDQVEQYDPPENPAKSTDSRFKKYQEEHGDSSWELDALDPNVISEIVRTAVDGFRDDAKFKQRKAREDLEKSLLQATSDRWGEVVDLVSENGDDDDDE